MAETGAAEFAEIVEDRLLDGRLRLLQPRKGHRAGSDAILLAAALPLGMGGSLVDLGAGVGTIGLAAALADSELSVVLVERDGDFAALARRNVALNGFEARLRVVELDVAAPAAAFAAAGLPPGSAGCVAMNPPFFAPGTGRASPVPNRRGAHIASEPFAVWAACARRLLAPGGTLAVIHRSEALPEMLDALRTGFGAVAVRPVQPAAGQAAIRVLLTARLGSRAPFALLPALVLHGADGGFTAEAEALHRGSARLA